MFKATLSSKSLIETGFNKSAKRTQKSESNRRLCGAVNRAIDFHPAKSRPALKLEIVPGARVSRRSHFHRVSDCWWVNPLNEFVKRVRLSVRPGSDVTKELGHAAENLLPTSPLECGLARSADFSRCFNNTTASGKPV